MLNAQVILMEEESSKQLERILLDLNKSELSYLTTNRHNEALQYFQQFEKVVMEELKASNDSPKANQLAGITNINLVCYYKKYISQHAVVLIYLKKSLLFEEYKVEDQTSAASTHLNILVIYSNLKLHQQSLDHAELALIMLEKVDLDNLNQSQVEVEKSYFNIKMLQHYNIDIQLWHLRRYALSRAHYLRAKQTAGGNIKKNQNLLSLNQDSLQRIYMEQQQKKQKLIDLLAMKKSQQQKGKDQFMRKNKKNFGDHAQWRSILQNKKYQLYKTEQQSRRHYQIADKFSKLAPINDDSHSKRGLEAL